MKRHSGWQLLTLWICVHAVAADGTRFDAIIAAEEARDASASALAAAVKSEDPELRARAAVALGRIMTPGVVDPLLGLLGDADPTVRAEAIFALGQLGWVAGASGNREKEIAAKLEPILKDSDAMRALAVEALGKVGLDGAPSVVAPALQDLDAAVRAEAAMALFRYRLVLRLRADPNSPPVPELDDSSMKMLLSAQKDTDGAVRLNVAYYFARVKDGRGGETVTALAKDPEVWVRLYAVTALGRSEDPNHVAAAVDATRDADERVRIAAVAALGALKSGSQAPASLAKDSSIHVRSALADAYGGDAKSDGAVLLELAKDPSAEVRAAAIKAIAARDGAKSLERLENTLKDSNPILREAATAGAASLGKDGEALLEKARTDSDELVRATALEALAAREGAPGLESIRSALNATGVGERGTAVEALKSRKEPEALEMAWTAYQGSGDHKWIEIRETLVDIFAAAGGEVGLRYLTAASSDPAPSVARKAIAALIARGARDLPAAPSPDRTVTPYAASRWTTNPMVTLETTKGTMRIECFAADTPIHVANFVGLVKKGFYDGLLWHRVVPNFVIQGGDPLGTGWGDAGWSLRAEVNRHRYGLGALGMPRGQGFDTGSCQLFFSIVPTPHLDGQYTVFGRIVDGQDVLNRIERGDRILKASVSH